MCLRSGRVIGTGTAFFNGAGLVNGEVAGTTDDFGVSLNTNGFLLAGTGNPDTTVVSSGAGYTDGQAHLVTFKRTRSTGALALYADGLQVGSATGGTESLTASGHAAGLPGHVGVSSRCSACAVWPVPVGVAGPA